MPAARTLVALLIRCPERRGERRDTPPITLATSSTDSLARGVGRAEQIFSRHAQRLWQAPQRSRRDLSPEPVQGRANEGGQLRRGRCWNTHKRSGGTE